MSTSTAEIGYIVATSLIPQLLFILFTGLGLLALFVKAIKRE